MIDRESCRAVIFVPARRESSRLADKLLLRETGKPLLQHTIERCLRAVADSKGRIKEVVLACDDLSLKAVAHAAGITAIMTGKHHLCGTTRIAEAVTLWDKNQQFDVVINVQGDEPEIAPEAILAVLDTLLENPAIPMSTLAVPLPAGSESMKNNPNAVKVVVDAQQRALYFSRAPIPYDRNPCPDGEPLWRHHLGIYAYRKDFLLAFAAMPPSPLELREGLEQLRALEAGYRISVGDVPAAWAAKGIDTADDYSAFVARAA